MHKISSLPHKWRLEERHGVYNKSLLLQGNRLEQSYKLAFGI